jgi:hypothetical protein
MTDSQNKDNFLALAKQLKRMTAKIRTVTELANTA